MVQRDRTLVRRDDVYLRHALALCRPCDGANMLEQACNAAPQNHLTAPFRMSEQIEIAIGQSNEVVKTFA